MRIDVIAAGRLKKGPLFEVGQDYLRRINWTCALHETDSKHKDPAAVQKDEEDQALKLLRPSAYAIALDEKGKSLKSIDFARKIEHLQTTGHAHIQFIIGGANGLTDTLRDRADFLLSFGQQTWPHMLARVMLLEQLYRAQQILDGHPYHRE